MVSVTVSVSVPLGARASGPPSRPVRFASAGPVSVPVSVSVSVTVAVTVAGGLLHSRGGGAGPPRSCGAARPRDPEGGVPEPEASRVPG